MVLAFPLLVLVAGLVLVLVAVLVCALLALDCFTVDPLFPLVCVAFERCASRDVSKRCVSRDVPEIERWIKRFGNASGFAAILAIERAWWNMGGLDL